MASSRLARRYAKSLVGLAIERDQLQKVYEDAELIAEINKQSREFKVMLKSPIINGDKKRAVISAVLQDKVSDLMNTFIDLLIRKGRESQINEIAHAIIDQYKEIKDIHNVSLITAVEIDDKIRTEIGDMAINGQGATVDLTTSVDPDLIGGFVLQFEHQIYDASIARKLATIKKKIKDDSYIAKL